jgi:hypothetical protein
MDHDSVALALNAWAVWSRQDVDGPLPPTCRSMESRYLPPAGEVFVGVNDREVREPEVPDHVGQRVERAVLAIGDPFRTAIVAFYVRRQPLEVIARRLHVGDARQVLDVAHQRIAAQLA